ncbi:serine/threonine protein phosphatase [Amycolatopsis sp. K13G38]|uniref:Serine/threonine protein phosphatase n=1 Tax=Amycolatopsis acididurans TaxID=2724524 RepID=A0ABX1IYY9_9PSEU|nr:PP2C family serine/threonine-protein phosphatase [Amycolatopsis acididurans]NKQ52740.1 serine/threonine protein phosphatase [Amycolatopsis acididurans]
MGVVVCPACGAAVEPAHRFCENCGENLYLRRTPEGGPLGAAGPDCPSCGGVVADDGFCEDCGRARPSGRDRMEFDLGLVAGVSDRGRVRARNEDSMAFATVGPKDAPGAVVVTLADGVGSTRRADEASQAAVDAALERIADCLHAGKDARESTVDGFAAAADVVATLGEPRSSELAPSCTLVSVIATPGEITVGWIGDSRAYWLDGARSRKITVDDTLYAQLREAGWPEQEASANPNAHALARWVGADADREAPGIAVLSSPGPGLLLVCSDGLWNYVPAAVDLAGLVAAEPPLAVAAKLTAVALEAGGGDNITVVVLPYPFDVTESE